MKKALQVKTTGEIVEIDLEAHPKGELKAMQEAVGGYIERVGIEVDGKPVEFWCDEEGLFSEKDNNVLGSVLYAMAGGRSAIKGDILFTGGSDPEGYTLGLTPEQEADVRFNHDMLVGFFS